MGPTIILDKSSLQSLSSREIAFLHRYYLINVTGVLTMEILADLKKDISNENNIEEVKRLANKILNMDMVINAHYLHMLYNSIRGYEPVLDGRPNKPGGRQVIDREGRKGIIFEESAEEAALNRWRNGEIEAAEEVLAERWRFAISKIDLDSLAMIGNRMKSTFSDLADVLARIDIMFDDPSSQAVLILLLDQEFGLSNELQVKAMNRVGVESGGILLKDVAPYAAYCLRANMLFKLGVMQKLIGTRSTNRIDLQYLYYLPFCNIFTSNDKFHERLAPLLLRPYQVFSSGRNLKDDLRILAEREEDESVSGSLGPPDIEGSLTVSLWKKHMKYDSTEHKERVISKSIPSRKEKEIVSESNYLAGLADDPKAHYQGHFKEDEIDFMIVKRSVGPLDPCPCKSGKIFRDCHWDEVKKSS